MKLKILLVFFLAHFQLAGSAQNWGLMDEQFETVRAEKRIKEIKRFVSTRVKKSKLTFRLENESIYNEQGKILKSVRYLNNGPDSSNTKVSRHINLASYDNRGRIISFTDKVDFYNKYSNDIVIHKTFEYDHPDSDQIATVYYHRPDGSMVKPGIYNIKNTASTESILQSDFLSNRNTYHTGNGNQKSTYDKPVRSNIKNHFIWIPKLNFSDRKNIFTNFTYDQFGNELEMKQTTKAGKVVNRFFNTFNADGLLKQTTWTKEKDKLKEVMRYTYEYF